MISREILDNDPKSLAYLLIEKGFYLGGSRYFSNISDLIKINKNTDWDLFGENSIKNKFILEECGFTMTMDKVDNDRHIDNLKLSPDDDTSYRYWYYKGDDLLAYIYTHNIHNIQVLLRTDVELYKKVFYELTPQFYHDKIWKSSPLAPKFPDIQRTLNELFQQKI